MNKFQVASGESISEVASSVFSWKDLFSHVDGIISRRDIDLNHSASHTFIHLRRNLPIALLGKSYRGHPLRFQRDDGSQCFVLLVSNGHCDYYPESVIRRAQLVIDDMSADSEVYVIKNAYLEHHIWDEGDEPHVRQSVDFGEAKWGRAVVYRVKDVQVFERSLSTYDGYDVDSDEIRLISDGHKFRCEYEDNVVTIIDEGFVEKPVEKNVKKVKRTKKKKSKKR